MKVDPLTLPQVICPYTPGMAWREGHRWAVSSFTPPLMFLGSEQATLLHLVVLTSFSVARELERSYHLSQGNYQDWERFPLPSRMETLTERILTRRGIR